jgi:hypothetical protein
MHHVETPMPNLSRYCKAYLAGDLREFRGWTTAAAATPADSGADPSGDAVPSDDVHFVHDNYVVTRGIYADEGVVFDEVTPEWVEFCTTVLKFEVPAFLQDGADGPEARS